jgi:hypothetical protein
MRLERANGGDQFQPRAHGSLSVVLMRLRVTEVHQHPIAHVLRDKAAEAHHSLCDALLIGRDNLARKSSGSMRADSAVEPTKSENITVTCRRSAVSWGFSSTVAGCAAAGLPSSWIAASIIRRCPSSTPTSLRSLTHRVG